MKNRLFRANYLLNLFWCLMVLSLLTISPIALADCTKLLGKYELHPLAKKYEIAGMYREFLSKDDFIISSNAKGMKLIIGENTVQLKPANEENKATILYIQSELGLIEPISFEKLSKKQIKARLNQICAVDFISNKVDKHDSLMITYMDMSKIEEYRYQRQDEIIKRMFPADIEWTELKTPMQWTKEELSSFQYFLVWSFNIPTITGGSVFIPLNKID